MRKFILVSFITLLTAIVGFSQSATTLRTRCPNTSIYAITQITGVGDINIQPCPNKTTTFTQNVVLPAGTVINGGNVVLSNGSAATPSLRFTNSLGTGLYRSAADTLGISTAGVANTTFSTTTNAFTAPTQTFTSATSDSHNTALFNINNAAANAEFKLVFTPGAAGLGSTIIGDSTGAGNTYIALTNSSSDITMAANSAAIGNFSNTYFGLSSGSFSFNNASSAAVFDLDQVLSYQLQRTITAGGTTGNQTISKPAGTVNLAAAASSIVVTNTTVNTSSIILTNVRTNDASCTFVKSAVPTANTITITVNAACGAETSVGFVVLN